MSFITIERRNSASAYSSVNSKSLSNIRSWSEDPSESTGHLANAEPEAKAQTLENLRQDETEVYWVSYMEGEQRVLLFTQHESVFLKAKSIIDPETSKREIFLSIAAIGVSLVSRFYVRFLIATKKLQNKIIIIIIISKITVKHDCFECDKLEID